MPKNIHIVAVRMDASDLRSLSRFLDACADDAGAPKDCSRWSDALSAAAVSAHEASSLYRTRFPYSDRYMSQLAWQRVKGISDFANALAIGTEAAERRDAAILPRS